MTHYTFNRYHLGDNLIFLHLLRALAKQRPDHLFVHFCNGCHIGQLVEVVQDLPNIMLAAFESPLWGQHKHEAINTWKNCGATDTRKGEQQNYVPGFWELSKHRWDWSSFTLEHHAFIAHKMGLVSPFSCREHLLFDWPLLQTGSTGVKFDFLIVNSEPCSGQFSQMAQHESGYLDELARALLQSGNSVFLTKPLKNPCFTDAEVSARCYQGDKATSTISWWGYISSLCKHHIMVATGPMWPTLNTHNHHNHEGRKRIVLLDNSEHLNMPHILQFTGVEPVMELAKTEGWVT